MARSKTNKPAPSPPPTPTQRWQWAVVVLAIAGIVAVSAYAVLRHQSELAGGEVQFQQLEITPPPDFVTDTFLLEVQALGGFGAVLDLSDRMTRETLREAFARHPWVEEVERIGVPAPNRLQVVLRYRTPIAVVRLNQDHFAIDARGRRLPSPPRNTSAWPSFMEIQGVEKPPRGKIGAPWGSQVVEAAAQLAALVADDRERLQLVAIEVDENELRQELRLRTSGGSRVLWQRWPDELREKSLSDWEKLERLRNYIKEHQSLDRPAGPYLHDVRPAARHLRKELLQK